jgi:hypothetical protein
MRKSLLILLLFVSTFSYGQIGWSNLEDNQWVTFTDAQSSGIYQLHPLPTTNQWMTKMDATYYLDVNPFYLSALTDNQWVTKSPLIANIYSATNIINWSFTVDDGLPDQYMTIIRNGSTIVNVNSYQTGSFTVYDGDVIVTTVHSATSGGNGNGATINIIGSNGVSYSGSIGGYDVTTTKTFTWIPRYSGVSIMGFVEELPTSPSFINTAYSMIKNKNDCGSTAIGSNVTYTVPANTYGSYVSQADADLKAYLDAYDNSQAYANTHGSCTPLSDTPTTINWGFSAPPMDGGSYMTITRQGYTMYNGVGDRSGSFTVSDTQYIIAIVVHTSPSFNEKATININNGDKLLFTTFNIGQNVSATYTLIWTASMGPLNILGSVSVP